MKGIVHYVPQVYVSHKSNYISFVHCSVVIVQCTLLFFFVFINYHL